MVEVQHAPVVATGHRTSGSSSGETSPLRRAPSEPYTGQLADIASLLKLDVLEKFQRQVSGRGEFSTSVAITPPGTDCVQRARCAFTLTALGRVSPP